MTNQEIRKVKLCAIVFGAIILLDQIVKIWVKTHLALGESIYVTDWFQIAFQENNGMAFSIELFDKIFLTLFRIVAVGVLFWLLGKAIKQNYSSGFNIGLTMVIAGALGNIIDCLFYGIIFSDSHGVVAQMFPSEGYGALFYGKVVDMLYFPLIDTLWPDWMPFVGGDRFIFFRPVFNIADSFICIGVFYLIIFQGKEMMRIMDDGKEEKKAEEADKAADENQTNEEKKD